MQRYFSNIYDGTHVPADWRRFQRHRHFVRFFNVPIHAPTPGQPFYGYYEKLPIFVAFYDTHRIRRILSRLNPWVSKGGGGGKNKKSRGVCETPQYAPGGNKVEKAIFSFKVTRSLTLVSFERASLVEYACQIWSLYLLRFKSYSEGYSWQQTNRQEENNMPPIIRSGGIKITLTCRREWIYSQYIQNASF